MAPKDDWSFLLTCLIVRQVRKRRKELGWSARDLSVACHERGLVEIPRSVIADLENARRQSISVAELLTLARALYMSPIDLVYPLEPVEDLEGHDGISSTVNYVLSQRDWWRGSKLDPGVVKDAETTVTEISAITEAISGLNDMLAKQQEEFTRKLAEQQKVIDSLLAQPNRAVPDRGRMQLEMLESLATLRHGGIEIPPEAMLLLERELPPGLLHGTVFCANGHEVLVGAKFCAECGISMTRADGEDLARHHIQTLRKMCRERRLPDTGTKDEVIARLTA